MDNATIRLLVLYSRLAGYTVACLSALRRVADADLFVSAWAPEANAPFSSDTLQTLGPVCSREGQTKAALLAAAREFRPDAVLVSGWSDPVYVSVCRELKRQGVTVIAGCDNQWAASPRQLLAVATAPLHLHRFIDVLWVPGERQRIFANALGYSGDRCWEGYYACDVSAFCSVRASRLDSPPTFLFVGRYVAEKGIKTLAAAYRKYRHQVVEPWPLVCAGAGPLRGLLEDCGAVDQGFVQPKDLPQLMSKAHAFVLPSVYEPWGVVLQEAAASGLPLIASRACGAAVHLLRDGWNGFAVDSGTVDSLADALAAMHNADPAAREAMGQASVQLASQYSPSLWADTLIRGVRRLS